MKKYIEYSTDTSTHLCVEVYYNLWWYSYFTWAKSSRWIYFSIRKVKKDFNYVSFVIFAEEKDFKYLLEELKRVSDKKLRLYSWKFEAIDNKIFIDLYERQIQLDTFLSLLN